MRWFINRCRSSKNKIFLSSLNPPQGLNIIFIGRGEDVYSVKGTKWSLILKHLQRMWCSLITSASSQIFIFPGLLSAHLSLSTAELYLWQFTSSFFAPPQLTPPPLFFSPIGSWKPNIQGSCWEAEKWTGGEKIEVNQSPPVWMVFLKAEGPAGCQEIRLTFRLWMCVYPIICYLGGSARALSSRWDLFTSATIWQIPPYTHRQTGRTQHKREHTWGIHTCTHTHVSYGSGWDRWRKVGLMFSLNEMSHLSRVGLSSLIWDINQ